MTLAEQINQDIKEAMRSRDQIRLETLRMLKSKILAADARGNVSDQDVVKLFKTYFGNLQEAYEQALAVNRADISDKLKTEMGIVQEYLPKTLSSEETRKLVLHAISESGAKTKKDFGLVMKHIMKTGASIDGKMAKELANEFLAD